MTETVTLSADAQAPAQRARIPVASWYALTLLFGVNMFAYVDRMALAMLQEQIKAELHTTDQQMGLLLGIAFALFYSTLGIPLARIADRASRPKMLAICLALWSVMTAVSGLARNFPQLFLARMGVGVGEAGCLPPGHSLIGDLFPRDRRAIAISIFQSGAVLGLSAGLFLVGYLGQHYGWRLSLQVIALAGLPLAVLLFLTVREPRTAQAVEASREPAKTALKALLGRRAFVHLVLAYALSTVCAAGVTQWLPAFLMRSFDMGMVEVGAWSGIASLISGIGGLLTGGMMVTWLARRDPRWELWLPAITMAMSLPLFALMFLSPVAWLVIVLKTFAQFLAAISGGVALSTVQSFAEGHRRATAVSLVLFLSSLLGQGMGPFLIGTISDLLAPTFGRESLRYAMFVSCIMLGWAVIHYWLASRTSERDRVN
jgi:MFS family permease